METALPFVAITRTGPKQHNSKLHGDQVSFNLIVYLISPHFFFAPFLCVQLNCCLVTLLRVRSRGNGVTYTM